MRSIIARPMSLCLLVLLAVASVLLSSRLAADIPDDVETALSAARLQMSQGEWEAALATAKGLVERHPDRPEAAEARILVGRAFGFAGRKDEAVASFASALETIPKASPWHEKARFLLAEAVIAKGELAAAARIYREEAERLTSDASRADLAARYRVLGDDAFAPKVDETDPLAKKRTPDHARARTFYELARGIFDLPTPHRELTERIAECSLLLRDGVRVELEALSLIEAFGEGRRAPDAAIVARARLLQAKARLLRGLGGEAREVLEGLLGVKAETGVDVAEVRILLGESFGLPTPRSVEDARAGIGHWERFTAERADDPRAFDIARKTVDAWLVVGEMDEAEKAARAFLARHGSSKEGPAVLAIIASIREGRSDFDGARAVAKEFLERYPDDSRVPTFQASLPRLLIAKSDHLVARKEPARAVTTLREFLTDHADHPSAPRVAVTLGDLSRSLGDQDSARRVWTSARERYLASDPQAAADAAYRLGVLAEEYDKDLAGAVAHYRRVVEVFPSMGAATLARERLAEMESIVLEVKASRIHSTDETPTISLSTRNLKSVTVKIHPIDMEAYFRSKRSTDGFEALDVTLVQPSRSFKVETAEYEPYRLDRRDLALEGLGLSDAEAASRKTDGKQPPKPGTYLVSVTDGERTSMVAVIVSDIRLVVKHTARQIVVMAVDVVTNDVAPDVKIVVSEGDAVAAEGRTDGTGLCSFDFEHPSALRKVLGERAGHVAPGCLEEVKEAADTGLTPKARLRFDRPIYRPGDEVRLRGILRDVDGSDYVVPPVGTEVRLSIADPAGRALRTEVFRTNADGSIDGAFTLGTECSPGTWSASASFANAEFRTTFEVRHFRRPEMVVEVGASVNEVLGRRPGDEIVCEIEAKTMLGSALEGAAVEWHAFRMPFTFDPSPLREEAWYFMSGAEAPGADVVGGTIAGTGRGLTDDRGRLVISLETSAAERSSRYVVVARATHPELDSAAGSAVFHVTQESFHGLIRADRKVYRSGDRAALSLITVAPDLRGVARVGEIVMSVREKAGGNLREISRSPAATGADGRCEVSLTTTESGSIEFRFEGRGAHDEKITFATEIEVRSDAFDARRDVRILAEREIYKVGETATAYLDVPRAKRPVLLTFEAERVLSFRVLRPEASSSALSLPLTELHAPNVAIAVATVDESRLLTSRDEIIVLRQLEVEVRADRSECGPREKIKLEITTKDQLGRPIAAELGLWMIDRSILSVMPDKATPIRAVFYDRKRPMNVATAASTAYEYTGRTRGIDRDLLEETARHEVKEQRRRLLEQARTSSGPQSDAAFVGRIATGGGATGGGGGGPTGGAARPFASPPMAISGSALPGSTLYVDTGTQTAVSGLWFSDNANAADQSLKLRFSTTYAFDTATNPDLFGLPAELGYSLETMSELQKIVRFESDVPSPAPGVEIPEVAPRLRFADLAAYAAHLTTDDAGKATLEVEVPDNLTTWEVFTEGASRATHVGDARTSVRVSKPIVARLERPPFMTHADEGKWRASIENRTDSELEVGLEVTSASSGAVVIGNVATPRVSVRSSGMAGSDVDVRSSASGSARISTRARAGDLEDTLESEVTIIPYGRRRFAGGGGVFDGKTILDFDYDGSALPGTGSATLVLARDAVTDLFECFLRLDRSGTGGADDVVARLDAAARLLAIANREDVKQLFEREGLARRVRDDLMRLAGMQRDDGGFAWCPGGQTNPFVLAAALEAMARCEAAGIGDIARMKTAAIGRAAALLGAASTTADAQAALAAGLARVGHDVQKPIAALVRNLRNLSPNGLARLAMASFASGLVVQGEEVLGRLEMQIRSRERGATLAGHVSEPWTSSTLEATALSLRSLIAGRRRDDATTALVGGLRRTLRESRSVTPKELAAALVALCDWTDLEASARPSGSIKVSLGEEVLADLRVEAKGTGRTVVHVPFEKIRRGTNRLSFESPDLLDIGYQLDIEWTSPQADDVPVQGEIRIARRWSPFQAKTQASVDDGFEIIRPESRVKPAPRQLTSLTVDGRYTTTLEIESDVERTFVVVDDPIPAGVDAVEADALGGFARVERLGTSMRFWFERLPKGRSTVTYTVWAAWPGRYAVNATTALAIYDAGIVGSSVPARLTIHPRGTVDGSLQPVAATPDQRRRKADLDFDAGRYAEADAAYAELLSLDLLETPRVEIMRRLLLAKLRSAKLVEAVATHDALAALRGLEPPFASADSLLLGRAFESVSDFERAKETFVDVIDRRLLDEVRYHDVLVDLDRRAEATEFMLDRMRRYPETPVLRSRWFATADDWFSIVDPSRAKAGTMAPIFGMRFERSFDEIRAVLAHLPLAQDAAQLAAKLIEHLALVQRRPAVVAEARRFLVRHAESAEAEDVQVRLLRATFEEGDWEGAKFAAKIILESTWPTGNSYSRTSRHSSEANYALGRMAHLEGRIAEAVELYAKVANDFEDARQSWLFFTETKLVVPPLTSVGTGETTRVKVGIKNVDEVEFSAYAVDLPTVFAIKKGIGRLHELELTGIAPDRRWTQKLESRPYVESEQEIAIDGLVEGTYLVVARSVAGTRTAIVVVSDVRVTLQRDGNTVRAYVVDSTTGAPVAGAEVRVGDGHRIVASSQTDERGIAVVKDLAKGVTVLAVRQRSCALAVE